MTVSDFEGPVLVGRRGISAEALLDRANCTSLRAGEVCKCKRCAVVWLLLGFILSPVPAGAVHPELRTCAQRPASLQVGPVNLAWLSNHHSLPSPGRWVGQPSYGAVPSLNFYGFVPSVIFNCHYL